MLDMLEYCKSRMIGIKKKESNIEHLYSLWSIHEIILEQQKNPYNIIIA